ncbi:MAG TPA: deoxyribose-phosphate aldolase [Phycisphaerales bacterium]|nr:deoxyribose-phosphate aldolase [Phycisphaerales bacterium]
MPTVDAVMAAERAASFTKRSIKTHTKRAALELALSMLDLTTLEGKDSHEKARSLCRKAMRPYPNDEHLFGKRLPSCGAVCVYPSLVPTCAEVLGDAATRTVKIASVATGFPSGQYPLAVRLDDVRRAVAAGADEIDMVISRGTFLAGGYDEVAEEIRATKRACQRENGAYAHLKVILETGELETLDNVRKASDLAIRAMHDVLSSGGKDTGAHNIDFIKTSTGKVQPAATMPVTLVMLEAIRDWYLETGCVVGMKPAGGIRSAKQAVQYLVMVHETMGPLKVPGFENHGGNPWLTPDYFRFGASTLCNDILRQLVRLKTGKYVAGYDFSEA